MNYSEYTWCVYVLYFLGSTVLLCMVATVYSAPSEPGLVPKEINPSGDSSTEQNPTMDEEISVYMPALVEEVTRDARKDRTAEDKCNGIYESDKEFQNVIKEFKKYGKKYSRTLNKRTKVRWQTVSCYNFGSTLTKQVINREVMTSRLIGDS